MPSLPFISCVHHSSKQKSAHIWVPDLAGTGGIQHYSRALLRALGELMPELSLHVMSKNDRSKNRAPGGFLVSDTLQWNSFGNWPKPLRTLAFAGTGWINAAREKPDYILCTHPHFTKALRHLKATIGVPYLTVCHGIETWGHVQGAMKMGLQGASRVIAVSQFTRQHLVTDCGFDPDHVAVVANTFDENLFQAGPKPETLLARYHLRPDQPVLLTVGRLSSSERYKGHEHVIRALPGILNKFPDVCYLIVGDGDDSDRLRQLCKKEGIEGNVVFCGHVPREELPLFYRLADVFVMPSTGEGFGIVFLEALASGLPVIAARSCASPEALDGGRLGLLVEPECPREITAAVVSLLDKKDRPELFNPDWLRSEVVRLFGFAAFKENLRLALAGTPAAIAVTEDKRR